MTHTETLNYVLEFWIYGGKGNNTWSLGYYWSVLWLFKYHVNQGKAFLFWDLGWKDWWNSKLNHVISWDSLKLLITIDIFGRGTNKPAEFNASDCEKRNKTQVESVQLGKTLDLNFF